MASHTKWCSQFSEGRGLDHEQGLPSYLTNTPEQVKRKKNAHCIEWRLMAGKNAVHRMLRTLTGDKITNHYPTDYHFKSFQENRRMQQTEIKHQTHSFRLTLSSQKLFSSLISTATTAPTSPGGALSHSPRLCGDTVYSRGHIPH